MKVWLLDCFYLPLDEDDALVPDWEPVGVFFSREDALEVVSEITPTNVLWHHYVEADGMPVSHGTCNPFEWNRLYIEEWLLCEYVVGELCADFKVMTVKPS